MAMEQDYKILWEDLKRKLEAAKNASGEMMSTMEWIHSTNEANQWLRIMETMENEQVRRNS